MDGSFEAASGWLLASPWGSELGLPVLCKGPGGDRVHPATVLQGQEPGECGSLSALYTRVLRSAL